MVDAIYSDRRQGGMNRIVGTYVKLFCFITAIMAQSSMTTTALMYFHAILNHLQSGITLYDKRKGLLTNPMHTQDITDNPSTKKQLPLVVFDHFEALPAAMKHCNNTANREMLSFIMYSIGQFSTSICHDQGLAHVLIVGDEVFTHKPGSGDEGAKSGEKGGFQTYLNHLMKHCEYWNLSGNRRDAEIYCEKAWIRDVDPEWENAWEVAGVLLDTIGTRPVDVSRAVKVIRERYAREDHFLPTVVELFVDKRKEEQRRTVGNICGEGNKEWEEFLSKKKKKKG